MASAGGSLGSTKGVSQEKGERVAVAGVSFRSVTARSLACSVQTAPANRRRSACSRRCSSPLQAPCASAALTPGETPGRSAPTLGCVLTGERSTYWKLTAKENLEYFAALSHIPPSVARRRIDRALGALSTRRPGQRPRRGLLLRDETAACHRPLAACQPTGPPPRRTDSRPRSSIRPAPARARA